MTDIDFQQWQEEVAVPPAEDCLRLCDYLPPDVQEGTCSIADQAKQILSYAWHSKENYEKAGRWIRGAVSSYQAGLGDTFFREALRDVYDYDRALRASNLFGVQPVRRKEIPKQIVKQVPAPLPNQPVHTLNLFGSDEAKPPTRYWEERYVLVKKKFAWNEETPDAAVDAVVLLMDSEAPDNLWIADYVLEPERQKKWDPIIYAEYGDWQVEVARWE